MKNAIAMRLVAKILMLAVLLPACVGTAMGQAYPARPVRVIVPYPPGGGADFVTRVLCRALSDALGQQFVVDNRAGANGNIGAEIVAKSAANGYTLLSSSNTTVTINPSLYSRMPIDMLRDLAPVSMFAGQPNALVVHPALPAKTVRELVALAQARPGELNYASAGTGSSSHIAAELFRMVAKINITHVAYKGNGPAMADLLGGQIPMMFNNLAPSVAQVKAGKLRALAITGEQRSSAAPDVPTMGEAGYPKVVFILWVGLLAPAGTPADIIAKLHAESVKAAQSREVRERLASEGADPYTTSTAQMTEIMRDETAKWLTVIKAANISLE